MAITATNLTANSSSTAGTSFSTASISPTTGKLILCAVASRRADSIQPLSPTVSGCGLTWVQVIGLDYDTSVATLKRLTIYRAMGTASTGAVTFDFGANSQTTCEWVIDEFAGTDTSGTNGSGAIVQSASQSYQPVSADPFTVTLAAFASANNGTYGVSTSDRGVVQSVGSGFTQVGSSGVSGVGAMSTMSEFVSTNQTTVAFNAGGTGNNAGIIGIELAASALFTDDFNRANESPLSGNWATAEGGGLQLISNAAGKPAASVVNTVSIITTSAAVFPQNQFVQANIYGTAGSAYDYPGLALRFSSTGGGTGYVVSYGDLSSNAQNIFLVWKVVSGAYTQIGTNISATYVAGATLYVEAVTVGGSSVNINVYYNGSLIGTRTDSSSIIASGQTGLFYNYGNNGAYTLDNFIAGSTASTFRAQFMLMGVG